MSLNNNIRSQFLTNVFIHLSIGKNRNHITSDDLPSQIPTCAMPSGRIIIFVTRIDIIFWLS